MLVVPSALLFARVFEVVFPIGIIVFLCSIPLNAVFREGRHGVGWIGDVNVRVNVHNGWGGLITFLHVCYIYAVLRCCRGL